MSAASRVAVLLLLGLAAGCGRPGAVGVLPSAKPDPKSFVAKPAREPGYTTDVLRGWLAAKRNNEREGLDNSHVTDQFKKMPELPYIRGKCADLFESKEFDEATLDRLCDWLCTTYSLSLVDVGAMPLEEVAARLRHMNG